MPDLSLKTDAGFKLLAWPRYDHREDLGALLREYGAAVSDHGDACMCLLHTSEDLPVEQAARNLGVVADEILGPNASMDILLIDDHVPPARWPEFKGLVQAVAALPSSVAGMRRHFVEAVGAAVVRDRATLCRQMGPRSHAEPLPREDESGREELPAAATRASGSDMHGVRRQLATAFLSGSGIEIGALHQPLAVAAHARVRYVDKFPLATLRAHYPELAQLPLVNPDIVDDAETLATVPDASQDFVIGNHLIEHCQDPIRALESWYRVLRPSGVLYMALPDKRFIEEAGRPVTSFEHLLKDYREGTEWSRMYHYQEWARYWTKAAEHDIEPIARRLFDMNYSIHFHAWTQVEFLQLVCAMQIKLGFELEAFVKSGMEMIFILRKPRSYTHRR